MGRPALIVHGGAGEIAPGDHADYLRGCKRAAEVAWKLLEGGASALHVVETAIRILEDDPTYDAGYGSVLNRDGNIEMDAILMDGRDLRLGAVIGIQNIANPITLARLIMEQTPHHILAGAGAQQFAAAQGIPFIPLKALISPKARRRHEQALANAQGEAPRGTVGAAAVDVHGNLAAGTSTGGTPYKLPGRVGDSPLVGSGAYADNETGAASATGEGEQIMRVVLCKLATDAIAQGMTAQQAADFAIGKFAARVQGQGGLIIVDHAGNIGYAHSTPTIAVAYSSTGPDGFSLIEAALTR